MPCVVINQGRKFILHSKAGGMTGGSQWKVLHRFQVRWDGHWVQGIKCTLHSNSGGMVKAKSTQYILSLGEGWGLGQKVLTKFCVFGSSGCWDRK